jgi:hypothetical protein
MLDPGSLVVNEASPGLRLAANAERQGTAHESAFSP